VLCPSHVTHEILCFVPHMFVRSLVSGSIRFRLAITILLSPIRIVLMSLIFNRSMVVIIMRLLLLFLI
jgi:hypothetical protein